jgi:hypothetical protein
MPVAAVIAYDDIAIVQMVQHCDRDCLLADAAMSMPEALLDLLPAENTSSAGA